MVDAKADVSIKVRSTIHPRYCTNTPAPAEKWKYKEAPNFSGASFVDAFG
jgi:hypothetical protein